MAIDRRLRMDRERANLRKLVTERGPDVGREVARLTVRGERSAAGLLEQFEAGAILLDDVAELSVKSGASGSLLFMIGVSTIGGADVLE